MPATMPTRDEAIQLVREALKRQLASHPDFKAEIRVFEPAVRQEDDWWYVCVYPSRELPNRYSFYELLAEAEGDLQDEQDKNILLVPVQPDLKSLPKTKGKGKRNGKHA